MSNYTKTVSQEQLSQCDKEPIHLLGKVQKYGGLLAFNKDWKVTHFSENIDDFLTLNVPLNPGLNAQDIFSASFLHQLRGALQQAKITGKNERLLGVTLEKSRFLDISVSQKEGIVLVEFENSTGKSERFVEDILAAMAAVLSTEKLAEQRIYDIAVRHLKYLTGFDRVMLYRFLPDGCGEVIAEEKEPALSSFLGLRYPASDIPKQARELYKQQLLRIISDVHDEGANIIGLSSGEALDLSSAVTRAVSPIHIQYLKNMGVGASMSISIVVEGELWGLFACHHSSAKILPFSVRTSLELFAQMYALELTSRERKQVMLLKDQLAAINHRVMTESNLRGTTPAKLITHLSAIAEIIKCDGIALCLANEAYYEGITPDNRVMSELRAALLKVDSNAIIDIESLKNYCNLDVVDSNAIAGAMFIPLARDASEFLCLFRQSVTKTVKWGGDPNQAKVQNQDETLTPRKSFEAWQDEHQHKCESWTTLDVKLADAIRIVVIEILLKYLNEQQLLLTESQKNKSVLISELNHRVRNILNLVRAIVKQSGTSTKSVEEFTELLLGRIQSLSNAHDQLTSSFFNAIELKTIIENETGTHRDENRINILGENVGLKPTAATCLVLVVHELFTNAVKYGALSVPNGQLIVSWRKDDSDGLHFLWKEMGLNNLLPPVKKGFGTTLIEKSIPHELNGSVSVEFRPDGLEVSIRIHQQYLDWNRTAKSKIEKLPSTCEAPSLTQALQHILVLEDNFLIASDTVQILENAGVKKVSRAANINEANSVFDNSVELALLDVNLGVESSLPFARMMADSGIPFIFTTGYGQFEQITQEFPSVQIIQKPYDDKMLITAINNLALPHQDAK
ncbi:HWE histidine kinase domain-containing protein [Planctobacterium marinum]|uniref:histidine kinase n=1 Tax=Planctobacterium marinum TaxID=1631968 RepID=A0AA48I2V5_9ALTE|nr:signal transduction histidine kinase [Planctobacterium marinum]